MIKNYTSIIVLITILFFGALSAQETQKNFINYQGVARNASNELMAGESMNIGVALKFGTANASAVYEENHSISTDANGVFSLLIGNGSPMNGNYNTVPWGCAATFVTVSMNGSEVGTTEMMAVPYAISSGDADDQSAAEVRYDNSASGLSATTTQEAIDELMTGGSVDADPDPSNEFQLLSFDAGTNELSLSDGNSITIPSGGTDADADPTNEIQTISFDAASNKISLTDGGEITIPSGGTDADADPANEFQTLSFDVGTNELSLSDGNSVTIPSGGTDADSDPENEIDVTRRHGILVGDDGIVDGLVGTADGQVAKWDATLGNWVAGNDETGGVGGSSLWSENAGNVYYDLGKVGIGTTTPQTSLSIGTDGSNWNLTDTEGDFRIGDATHRLKMSTSTGGAGAGNARIRSHGGSNRLLLGSGANDVLTIVDQRVGIGTLDPTAPLDVAGKNNWNPNTTEGDLRIGNDTYRLKIGVALGGAGAGDTRIRAEGGTNRMMLGGGANDILTVTDANVGVGTITPVASLDVQGDIRSSDLAGTGQRNVMADPDGNLVIGSTGGGSSLWTQDGSNINYTGGRVGIGSGSESPNAVLEVAGFANSEGILNVKDTELVGRNLAISGFGLQGRFEGANSSLSLNKNGGSIYMGSDVGIGLTGLDTPQSTLDVDGNIRSRDLSGGGNVVADANGNLVIGAGGGGGLSFPFFEEVTQFGAAFHLQNNTGSSGYGLVGSKGFDAEDLPSNTAGVLGRATNGHGVYGHSENDFYAGVMGISNSATGSGVLGFGIGGGIGGYFYTTSFGRAALSTGVGNVGIGTQDPTAKMHVLHDSNISSPQLRLEDSDADYARLEFKNTSAGFWHIAGRGGASGNVSRLNFYHHNGTTGRDYMTIAGSGNVGIGTTAPAAKLDVAGDIKTSGEVHGPTTGSANMIPIAYGQITGPGFIDSGSGNFSVERTSVGTYVIRIPDSGSSFDWVISATRHSSFPGHISVISSPLSLQVTTYNLSGDLINGRFSFIIYSP